MTIEPSINTKTQDRSLLILPFFEDMIFFIYNGRIFKRIKITKEMIGHKLGEFFFTKKRPVYKSKKKKKKKK